MIIFGANFALIALFWFIANTAGKRDKALGRTLTVFFMCVIAINSILLLSLRSTAVGTDTLNYSGRFDYFKSASWDEILDNAQEIGFSVLLRGVGMFSDSFQWVLFVVAILCVVPTFYVITKYSKLPFLSVLLFVAFEHYAFMFSGLRQAIAMSFCLFSYKYIRESKLIPFLLCIAFAVLFHRTAYCFLPAYFIAKMRPNIITYIFLGATFIVVAVFKDQLYDLIQQTWYRHSSFAVTDTAAFIWPLIISLVGVATIIFTKNIITCDPDDSGLIFLMLMGSILVVFALVGSNAKRLVEYYTVFLIFVIPCIIESIALQKVKTAVAVVVGIGVFGMIAFSMITDLYSLIPYSTFLSI